MEGSIMLGTNASDNLIDIRDVSIDRELPKHERIAQYVSQIKNPYHFKYGKHTIRASFAENGPPLEECLLQLAL
jgi:hypothetical protein